MKYEPCDVEGAITDTFFAVRSSVLGAVGLFHTHIRSGAELLRGDTWPSRQQRAPEENNFAQPHKNADTAKRERERESEREGESSTLRALGSASN